MAIFANEPKEVFSEAFSLYVGGFYLYEHLELSIRLKKKVN